MVDQLDSSIENTILKESDECDIVNEGTAEGSNDNFSINPTPRVGWHTVSPLPFSVFLLLYFNG